MTSPKEKPLLGGEGLGRRIRTAYIAQTIWQAWQREAARLLTLYWHTGNQKHLLAFYRHFVAMRVHEAEANQ